MNILKIQVEGDVNPDIAAASQNAHKLPPLESTTEAPQQPVAVYRQPAPQPAPQPAYQPPVVQRNPAPVSASPSLASYSQSQPASGSSIPSEYEAARAQVAASRYNSDRAVASAYQVNSYYF